jgi:excisionase family DNA binding protein
MSQRVPATTEQLLVPLTDAADALSLSRRHVHRLIAEGRLGSVRIGRRRLVPSAELERFVAQLEIDEDAAVSGESRTHGNQQREV